MAYKTLHGIPKIKQHES